MQPDFQSCRRHFSRRTAELGLAITSAADVGTLTIINATPVAVTTACPDYGQPGKGPDPCWVDTRQPGTDLTPWWWTR